MFADTAFKSWHLPHAPHFMANLPCLTLAASATPSMTSTGVSPWRSQFVICEWCRISSSRRLQSEAFQAPPLVPTLLAGTAWAQHGHPYPLEDNLERPGAGAVEGRCNVHLREGSADGFRLRRGATMGVPQQGLTWLVASTSHIDKSTATILPSTSATISG